MDFFLIQWYTVWAMNTNESESENVADEKECRDSFVVIMHGEHAKEDRRYGMLHP